MIIRPYQTSDCSEVIALFSDCIQNVNSKDYSPDQITAWIGSPDLSQWDQSLKKNHALVAVKDSVIIGFGDIQKDGYVDRLYTHKDYQGIGIASTLLKQLEDSVDVNMYSTHASITALPFFLSKGYSIERENTVLREGIELKNMIMTKKVLLAMK